MKIVIFTGGRHNETLITKNYDLVIAADSGAEFAMENGITPDIVIGDMDSISEQTKKKLQGRSKFVEFESEKDFTDTELAIDYAVKQKATEITIYGGIEGDRIDHILANILILSKYKIPIRFINGFQTLLVLTGPEEIELVGQKSDLLSLIPLSEKVEGIITKNLKYSLTNEALFANSSRGVSNVFSDQKIKIKFSKGTLCIVHTMNASVE